MEQYSDDCALADSHGLRLAYAVQSVWEGMLPPKSRMEFKGAIESGAPLADWRRAPDSQLSGETNTNLVEVEIPLKDWPAAEVIARELEVCQDRAIAERLKRKLRMRHMVGDGPTTKRKLWVWQLGDSVVIGHANEAYSLLQTALRERFSGKAIAVCNLVNGACGYLPTADMYDHDVYPVWQTPFDRGSLETMVEAAIAKVEELTGWGA
jgi:hypothetical protein